MLKYFRYPSLHGLGQQQSSGYHYTLFFKLSPLILFTTMSSKASNVAERRCSEETLNDPAVHNDGVETPGSREKPLGAENQPAYSIYTQRQKAYIVFMSGLGGFFAPLSANTYLPSVPSLPGYLGVSPSLINLTVTAFLIFQGLAPSFYGDLADIAGRRPAYLISFIIYIAANIGLASQSSYPALFVLRCLQVRRLSSPRLGQDWSHSHISVEFWIRWDICVEQRSHCGYFDAGRTWQIYGCSAKRDHGKDIEKSFQF